jgi:hypothetical protein
LGRDPEQYLLIEILRNAATNRLSFFQSWNAVGTVPPTYRFGVLSEAFNAVVFVVP